MFVFAFRFAVRMFLFSVISGGVHSALLHARCCVHQRIVHWTCARLCALTVFVADRRVSRLSGFRSVGTLGSCLSVLLHKKDETVKRGSRV